MGLWTVHICTVHSWQSQLLRAGKKKKKRGKRGEQNVDVQTKRSHRIKKTTDWINGKWFLQTIDWHTLNIENLETKVTLQNILKSLSMGLTL